MCSFLFISTLLSCFWVVQSQGSLIQPPSEVKRPGETLKLSCKYSGSDFTKYWMQWVRQPRSLGLSWIGEANKDATSTNVRRAFQERFKILRDNANSLIHLEVRNLQPEDSAVYYCAAHSDWRLGQNPEP